MRDGPWLLLDVSYLAYRVFFAMGHLSFESIPTTVVYGVLRDVLTLEEMFNSMGLVFCFDAGKPLRVKILPEYKANRRVGKTVEEAKAKEAVRNQILALRNEYLPMVGFPNIFYQKGYEADDIIAQVIQDYPLDEFVIVSSDEDLYQLLSSHVSIWKPKKKELYTMQSFKQQWGLKPHRWAEVKAYAGCSGDNVPGVAGVGNITAAKYLRGDLTKGKAFDALESAWVVYDRNMKLVTLPFPNCKSRTLTVDHPRIEGWEQLIKKLGMHSLAAMIPGIPRRGSKTLDRTSL